MSLSPRAAAVLCKLKGGRAPLLPHLLRRASHIRPGALPQPGPPQRLLHHELRMDLADAHAHPQADPPNVAAICCINAIKVAVMGVQEADWPDVEQMCQLAPLKVIPCYGVHPW